MVGGRARHTAGLQMNDGYDVAMHGYLHLSDMRHICIWRISKLHESKRGQMDLIGLLFGATFFSKLAAMLERTGYTPSKIEEPSTKFWINTES